MQCVTSDHAASTSSNPSCACLQAALAATRRFNSDSPTLRSLPTPQVKPFGQLDGEAAAALRRYKTQQQQDALERMWQQRVLPATHVACPPLRGDELSERPFEFRGIVPLFRRPPLPARAVAKPRMPRSQLPFSLSDEGSRVDVETRPAVDAAWPVHHVQGSRNVLNAAQRTSSSPKREPQRSAAPVSRPRTVPALHRGPPAAAQRRDKARVQETAPTVPQSRDVTASQARRTSVVSLLDESRMQRSAPNVAHWDAERAERGEAAAQERASDASDVRKPAAPAHSGAAFLPRARQPATIYRGRGGFYGNQHGAAAPIAGASYKSGKATAPQGVAVPPVVPQHVAELAEPEPSSAVHTKEAQTGVELQRTAAAPEPASQDAAEHANRTSALRAPLRNGAAPLPAEARLPSADRSHSPGTLQPARAAAQSSTAAAEVAPADSQAAAAAAAATDASRDPAEPLMSVANGTAEEASQPPAVDMHSEPAATASPRTPRQVAARAQPPRVAAVAAATTQAFTAIRAAGRATGQRRASVLAAVAKPPAADAADAPAVPAADPRANGAHVTSEQPDAHKTDPPAAPAAPPPVQQAEGQVWSADARPAAAAAAPPDAAADASAAQTAGTLRSDAAVPAAPAAGQVHVVATAVPPSAMAAGAPPEAAAAAQPAAAAQQSRAAAVQQTEPAALGATLGSVTALIQHSPPSPAAGARAPDSTIQEPQRAQLRQADVHSSHRSEVQRDADAAPSPIVDVWHEQQEIALLRERRRSLDIDVADLAWPEGPSGMDAAPIWAPYKEGFYQREGRRPTVRSRGMDRARAREEEERLVREEERALSRKLGNVSPSESEYEFEDSESASDWEVMLEQMEGSEEDAGPPQPSIIELMMDAEEEFGPSAPRAKPPPPRTRQAKYIARNVQRKKALRGCAGAGDALRPARTPTRFAKSSPATLYANVRTVSPPSDDQSRAQQGSPFARARAAAEQAKPRRTHASTTGAHTAPAAGAGTAGPHRKARRAGSSSLQDLDPDDVEAFWGQPPTQRAAQPSAAAAGAASAGGEGSVDAQWGAWGSSPAAEHPAVLASDASTAPGDSGAAGSSASTASAAGASNAPEAIVSGMANGGADGADAHSSSSISSDSDSDGGSTDAAKVASAVDADGTAEQLSPAGPAHDAHSSAVSAAGARAPTTPRKRDVRAHAVAPAPLLAAGASLSRSGSCVQLAPMPPMPPPPLQHSSAALQSHPIACCAHDSTDNLRSSGRSQRPNRRFGRHDAHPGPGRAGDASSSAGSSDRRWRHHSSAHIHSGHWDARGNQHRYTESDSAGYWGASGDEGVDDSDGSGYWDASSSEDGYESDQGADWSDSGDEGAHDSDNSGGSLAAAIFANGGAMRQDTMRSTGFYYEVRCSEGLLLQSLHLIWRRGPHADSHLLSCPLRRLIVLLLACCCRQSTCSTSMWST